MNKADAGGDIRAAHLLLTCAEMADADRRTIAGGKAGAVLMERAGAAVAEAARSEAAAGGRIAVLVGAGSNGGDGYVAARLLKAVGFTVTVAALPADDADPAKPAFPRPGTDAARAAGMWSGGVAALDPAAPPEADLYVDALFGAGLARDLDGVARAAVQALNARKRDGAVVIAVDLPSGLDGDTGLPRGIAVEATRTITFARRKPGHLLLPGRALCGPVTVADIGIAASTLAAVAGSLHANHPDLWRDLLPLRGAADHKYKHGHAGVLAGGLEGIGAPRLAARAALRSGAGLVTLACDPAALAAHAARGPDALMVRAPEDRAAIEALALGRRWSAVVAGPALGLDAAAADKVAAALAMAAPAVLDADALTLLAGRLPLLARTARRKPVILTPHEGEFARLFGDAAEFAGRSKLERARAAARSTGAVIVLKGADTVVAAPDGRAVINENAPPWLATAGAGDVLSGVIAGLVAQGMPAFDAASAAVWLHGEAANIVGRGLIADDLVEALPRVQTERRLQPP